MPHGDAIAACVHSLEAVAEAWERLLTFEHNFEA